MKVKSVVAIIIMVLVLGSIVYADNIDVSGSLNGFYSVSVDLMPEVVGDVAFIFDYNTQGHSAMLDHKGNMTAVGDYEVVEGRKDSIVIGLGYKAGFLTPWVALSAQSTKTIKDEIVLKDSNPTKTKTDITDPLKGVAFGINAEHWVGPWGALGTVAKIPGGVLFNGRVKYKVSSIGTAHVGYIYNTNTGQALVAGLGLSY